MVLRFAFFCLSCSSAGSVGLDLRRVGGREHVRCGERTGVQSGLAAPSIHLRQRPVWPGRKEQRGAVYMIHELNPKATSVTVHAPHPRTQHRCPRSAPAAPSLPPGEATPYRADIGQG